jgi:hypothetical protein
LLKLLAACCAQRAVPPAFHNKNLPSVLQFRGLA